MTATSFPHWAELLAKLAAMAAAYYAVGRLGLLLAIPPGYATAVWPASGIASWYSTVRISSLAGHFARVVFN